MRLIETELQGVRIIENFKAEDNRGMFVKTYHEGLFKENDLCTKFKESYFSVSKKNVIRGMHFQIPPHDHEKLVYVVSGEITDVVLDLRKSSKTYGKYISIALSGGDGRSVYIPKGFAHGFKSHADDTTVVYNVSTVYDGKSDWGIRFDSFGFDWETLDPIVSDRDLGFIGFDEFVSQNPF